MDNPCPGPEARKQPGKGLPTGFPRLCALQIRAQPKPPETGKTRRRKTAVETPATTQYPQPRIEQADRPPTVQYVLNPIKALTPHEGKQKDWMMTIKDQLNAGRIYDVIADLKPHLRLEAVATCIRCCETNKGRMRCDLCRKHGLSTRSGTVESACKQTVGSRFKRAGCRWSKAGANALLATECCIESNRWVDFLDWKACRGAAASPKIMRHTLRQRDR